jgi:Ni/Co efflux regulator RcnB
MKALVSAIALLTFVAGTTLPSQSHAQATTSGGQTMAPDTATPSVASTKKKRSSKSHHAKKKSKKSSTSQTSSTKQKHSRHNVS